MRILFRDAFSDEAKLTLLSISTAGRRSESRDRAAQIAAGVDADVLAGYIVQQRLTLTVPGRLAELGLSQLAADLEQKLAARREVVKSHADVQAVLTSNILERLEAGGIPVVPLKGIVLSRRLYDDDAARESTDIDVLVAPEDLSRAAAIAVDELFYSFPVDALAKNGLPLLHYSMLHPAGWPSLELHWRFHWYEEFSGVATLRRSVMTDVGRRMLPADEFATLLLFYARDGFLGVRNLAAIAAWWDRYGAQLMPDGLAGFVAEFPELAPAVATSAAVASRLVGLPSGALVLDRAPATPRSRRAARLADPQPRVPHSTLQAATSLVDLLLAPTFDVRGFITRQMLLNTSYVAIRSRTGGHDDDERRFQSIERGLKRGARMLVRLLQSLRPRVHG